MQDLTFIDSIPPTHENAVSIQKLTLQDVLAGGFANPLTIADPDNGHLVDLQLEKLRIHPRQYCGYTRDGELVAFMKQSDWFYEDELSFATTARSLLLKARRVLRLSPSTGQWGIFGLVVSGGLSAKLRDHVLTDLLKYAIECSRRSSEYKDVNVVLHKKDPLTPIALRHGFHRLGKPGEASGAPGLVQVRYMRHRYART